MRSASVGAVVTINGVDYRIQAVGPPSTEKKFWGKRKFTLRKLETDEIYFAFGNHVQHNTRVTKQNGSPNADNLS